MKLFNYLALVAMVAIVTICVQYFIQSEVSAATCKKPPKQIKKEAPAKVQKKKRVAKSKELAEVLNIYETGDAVAALKTAESYESIQNGAVTTEIRLVKLQISSFIKVVSDLKKALNNNDSTGVINNADAGMQLDAEIAGYETSNSEKLKKIRATGYYLGAKKFEREDKYSAADNYIELCLNDDSEKSDCKKWVDEKKELVKRIYTKGKMQESFSPEKAAYLYKELMKIVTCDNEYYKKAEISLNALKK